MKPFPFPTAFSCVSAHQCHRGEHSRRSRNRALILPFVFLLALAGCGGGGGGSVGGGPLEIAYVLSEDPNNSNHGYVVEYGLNPATNQFQMSASGPISTQGVTPIQFLLNPDKTLAFVLNNGNTNGNTSANGSIAVYQVGANGLSTTPHVFQTGQNPVNMALDPGGNYLVVANHGNGQSTSGTGSVEVFTVSSNGQLNALSTSGSPCTYPFRVVFAPNSNDVFYVACSSPELLGGTPPPPSLYICTISSAGNGTFSCPSTPIPTFNLYSAFINFVIDPSNTYAVAPGTTVTSSTATPSGFLLVCSLPLTTTPSCQTNSSSFSSWIPSGNVAFEGTPSNGITTYIGNYNPSSFSSNFAACTTSSSSSPTCTTTNSTSQDGPLYLATQENVLYIADTVTPITGSYSTSGTTMNAQNTSSGYLYACSISIPTTPSNCNDPSSTSNKGNTGEWPVGITFDTRDMVFVPTLSGEINIFTGASTGGLVPFQTLTDTYTPLSVTIQ